VFQFDDHSTCLVLAVVLKGKLCDKVFTGEIRHLQHGEAIYQPDDGASMLHRVVTGSVGLSSLTPDGDEMMLQVYSRDEIFGELCFCTGRQMHFARALEPAQIVSARADHVIAALGERPDLALDLIRLLSERLGRAYAELQAASADPLLTRLAKKFFELSVIDTGDGWCRLPRHFTHDELAHLLNVRRESLTRAMIDLRALGLIDYRAHQPVRVAVAALQRFVADARSNPLPPYQPRRAD